MVEIDSAVFGATGDKDNRVEMRTIARRGSPDLDVIQPKGKPSIDLAKMRIGLHTEFKDSMLVVPIELSAPGPGQTLEYEVVLVSPAAILTALRNRVYSTLEPIVGKELAGQIANTPIVEKQGGDTARYDTGKRQILLPNTLGEAVSNPNSRETLYHEFFHAFQNLALQDSGWIRSAWVSFRSGGSHDDPNSATNEYFAYDEGRGHFFARLLTQVHKNEPGSKPVPSSGKPRLYPLEETPEMNIASIQKVGLANLDGGAAVENVVAGFILDFYGDAVQKDPQGVLKDFYQTSQEYAKRHDGDIPATIGEFITAKREIAQRSKGTEVSKTAERSTLPLGGKIDEIDELAARYGIPTGSNESQLANNRAAQRPALSHSEKLSIMKSADGNDGKEVELNKQFNLPPGALLKNGGASPASVSIPSEAGKDTLLTLSPSTTIKAETNGVTIVAPNGQKTPAKLMVDTGGRANFYVGISGYGRQPLIMPKQTRYVVEVEPDGRLSVQVLDGQVALVDKSTADVVNVSAGRQLQVRSGEKLSSATLNEPVKTDRWWEAASSTADGRSDGGGKSALWMLIPVALLVGGGVFVVKRRKPRPINETPTIGLKMYCGQCGAPIEKGARFCGSCGARV